MAVRWRFDGSMWQMSNGHGTANSSINEIWPVEPSVRVAETLEAAGRHSETPGKPAPGRDRSCIGRIHKHFPPVTAYRRCGIRHFRTLGGKDVRPFKNVEASVRQPCGKHIAEVRKAIKKIGIHSKNRRTAIINLEYKRILQDFRIAYLSAKSEMLITTKLKEVMPDWKSCVERFSRITDKPSGLSADHLVKIALWYCLKE